MRDQRLDQCIITVGCNPDWTKRHQALMPHFLAGATELVRTEIKNEPWRQQNRRNRISKHSVQWCGSVPPARQRCRYQRWEVGRHHVPTAKLLSPVDNSDDIGFFATRLSREPGIGPFHRLRISSPFSSPSSWKVDLRRRRFPTGSRAAAVEGSSEIYKSEN